MQRVKQFRAGAVLRLRLLGMIALAPLLLMLEGSPAAAQPACPSGTSISTCLLQDQQTYLQSFANLPNSSAGTAALSAALTTVENIYANGTTAQRNQALINATTGPINIPQANIWGMISNLPSSSYPLNASSFSSTFPSISQSANLATTVSSGLVATPLASVYDGISNVIGTMWGPIQQVGGLKDAFTSYNTYFVQGLGQTSIWGGSVSAPNSIDLRPYQVSTAIANAPWSSQLTTGQWPENVNSPSFMSGHSTLGNTTALIYSILQPQAYQSLMVSGQQFGLSRNLLGVHYPLDIIGGRILAYYTTAQLMAGTPLYAQAWAEQSHSSVPFSTQMASLQSQLNQQLGNTLTAVPYAQCGGSQVASCIAAGTFPTAAQFTAANQTYAALATYGLPSVGPTNAAPVVPANAWLLLSTRFPYLTPAQINDVLASTDLPSGGPLDDGTGWVRLNLYAAAGGYGAFTSNVSVTMNASAIPANTSQPGFNAIDVWSNNISGPGGLTLLGSGTLVLAGNNTYTGGTTVGCATGIGCATLALTGTMIGNLTINQGATFVSGGGYSVSPSSTLSNAGTFQSVNSTLLNQGTLLNSGAMLSSVINAGTVTNTGTMTGAFTNYGTLSGTGTMVGNVTNSAGGTVAPGVAGIGTLSVSGTYTHAAGSTYSPGVAGNGQSDLLNVGGTAAIQGGNVVVYAQPGTTYAPVTTYRILNAAGGLSGSFAAVNELYPFLLSSLSYDANNAYLTLQIGGFAAAAATPTQAAVGNVLDANVNTATGDFAQVLSAMATGVQSNASAQYVLQQLSGNNYAGFSSSMVQGAQLFMNNFAGQAGGGGPIGSGRIALAEACDVACDSAPPATWGAWGGALGGLGTIGAGQPAGAVTYNAGGFAAGLDRALTERVRLGATAGYTTGTQWVSGFDGLGRTDTFQVGVYGNYTQDKVYADALFGYAYSWNQMWRNISIPGLQQRTALGQTGANQWYGQLETGYRFDLGTAAQAFVTPFARLQGYTGTQNAFTETGAQSLNLSVAQQTTNSLRSVLGAQLGGSVDLGWRERLALRLRLGWSHEYASTARPVSATLAGAPAMPFTTWGVSPTRDGALLGFGANTAIAEATSVYLRYEGNIAGQDSAHALTAGLRMTW